MDYNRNECQVSRMFFKTVLQIRDFIFLFCVLKQGVVRNSEGNLFNLKPSAGVSFFETVCLRGEYGSLRPKLMF